MFRLTYMLTSVSSYSSTGKTQFLLQLLLSVQLPSPRGLSKNALYVSTETSLPSTRLQELLVEHSELSDHAEAGRPSLDNVFSMTILDIETQDHILEHHIPTAISRHNVGLLVIDSITANYRAEEYESSPTALLERALKLRHLGKLLRDLAVNKKIAVVVANQVSDQFTDAEELNDLSLAETNYHGPLMSQDEVATERIVSPLYEPPQSRTSTRAIAETPKQPETNPSTTLNSPKEGKPDVSSLSGILNLQIPDLDTVLTLDRQRSFQSGWGLSAGPSAGSKTPALGVVWTNQISCRIVLKMEIIPSISLHQELKSKTETRTEPEPEAVSKSGNPRVESPKALATGKATVIPPSSSSFLLGDDDDNTVANALKQHSDDRHSQGRDGEPFTLPNSDKSTASPENFLPLKRHAGDEKDPEDVVRRSASASPSRKVARVEPLAHATNRNRKNQEHDCNSIPSSPDYFATELPNVSYRRRRTMQVVFCPWASGCLSEQRDRDLGGGFPIEYEIRASGIRGIMNF